ncbi:MAG TPA: hypothetical protein VF950_11345 [Planctomycetota bacterium]
MDPLAAALDVHRRRLRALRAAEVAVRGTFWVSLAAGAALLLSRVAGLPLGAGLALGALAAAGAGLAAKELLRRFSRRDCAIELDRQLRLEERLSTALEGSGPMKDVQAADAAAALAAAKVPAWRAPREAKMLAGSLLVVLALSAAPGLETRGDADARRLEAYLNAEAAKLEGLTPEFKEVAEALRDGRAEEALARIEGLRAALAEKAASDGPGGAEARRLEEALGAAAQGVGAEIGRAGRTVRAPAPVAADAKLRRLLEGKARDVDGLPTAVRASVLDRSDWDPRYDIVVVKYFRGTP